MSTFTNNKPASKTQSQSSGVERVFPQPGTKKMPPSHTQPKFHKLSQLHFYNSRAQCYQKDADSLPMLGHSKPEPRFCAVLNVDMIARKVTYVAYEVNHNKRLYRIGAFVDSYETFHQRYGVADTSGVLEMLSEAMTEEAFNGVSS